MVALGIVLPAEQGRVIPEEIRFFLLGDTLEVVVTSDTSTNSCDELGFKYLISKGISESGLYFLFVDS